MTKKKLPRSLRKYIRIEKAKIARKALSLKEKEKLIRLLYERIGIKLDKRLSLNSKEKNQKNDNKTNI